MKFLIDMPLSPGLASWLNDQGYDTVHAVDLGMHRALDTAILERAAYEGRTVITADLDYPRLLALTKATEPSLFFFAEGTGQMQVS